MSIYVNIISSHPTKQPINKRTYVVTYPHQSHIHHVLINESVCTYHGAMPIHLGTDPRNHVLYCLLGPWRFLLLHFIIKYLTSMVISISTTRAHTLSMRIKDFLIKPCPNNVDCYHLLHIWYHNVIICNNHINIYIFRAFL